MTQSPRPADPDSLRRFLEALIRTRGWTSLHQLASEAGVRDATLSKWWSGTKPDTASLEALAGALGRSPQDLVAVYYGASWGVIVGDERLDRLIHDAVAAGVEGAVRALGNRGDVGPV